MLLADGDGEPPPDALPAPLADGEPLTERDTDAEAVDEGECAGVVAAGEHEGDPLADRDADVEADAEGDSPAVVASGDREGDGDVLLLTEDEAEPEGESPAMAIARTAFAPRSVT